jgi:hypothetical protein
MPAFATKEEIAYQRNIVISPDGYLTVGAKGAGRNDGKIPGQAINTNIQKATHATTQKRNEYQYRPMWHHRFNRYGSSGPILNPRRTPIILTKTIRMCQLTWEYMLHF